MILAPPPNLLVEWELEGFPLAYVAILCMN